MSQFNLFKARTRREKRYTPGGHQGSEVARLVERRLAGMRSRFRTRVDGVAQRLGHLAELDRRRAYPHEGVREGYARVFNQVSYKKSLYNDELISSVGKCNVLAVC